MSANMPVPENDSGPHEDPPPVATTQSTDDSSPPEEPPAATTEFPEITVMQGALLNEEIHLSPDKVLLLKVLKEIIRKKVQEDNYTVTWLDSLSPSDRQEALNERPHRQQFDLKRFTLSTTSFAVLLDACLEVCVPGGIKIKGRLPVGTRFLQEALSSAEPKEGEAGPENPPSQQPNDAPSKSSDEVKSQDPASQQANDTINEIRKVSDEAKPEDLPSQQSNDGAPKISDEVKPEITSQQQVPDPTSKNSKSSKASRTSKVVLRSSGIRRQGQMRQTIRLLNKKKTRPSTAVVPPSLPTLPVDINCLPSEILRKTMKYAQVACCAEVALPVDSSPDSKAIVPYTAWEAQRWHLSLSLVCRCWRSIATPAVWSDLYIKDLDTFDRFMKTLDESPHLRALLIDKSVVYMGRPIPPDDIKWTDPSRKTSNYDTSLRLYEETALDNDKNDDHLLRKAAKFARLASTLQNLCLYLCVENLEGSFFIPAYLHVPLTASSMRSFTLDLTILFADLEELLLQSKTLRALKLLAGTDSGDHLDEVSVEDHKLPLVEVELLYLRDVEGKICKSQLCWLLRPAVGSLTHLHLRLPSYIRRVTANGTTTHTDIPQPYASALFANLLIQLGPTLKKLTLTTAFLRQTMALTDLQEEPHNGSLDFALSHCQHLEELEVTRYLISGKFLDSLGVMSKLKLFTLDWLPETAFDAKVFTQMIEEGRWSHLKEIRVLSFKVSQSMPMWSAQKIRRFIWACKKRDIAFT